MKRMILLLFLLFTVPSFSQSVLEVQENNEAVKYIKADDLGKAADILHRLLAQNPELVVSQINLATVYSMNQDPKGARELLLELHKRMTIIEPSITNNESFKTLSFIVRFNTGFLFSLEKSGQDSALEFYGEALEIYPNDLATKVNIELITQNMEQKGKQNQQNQDQKQQQGDSDDKKQQKQQQQNQQQQQQQQKKKKKKPKFKENELKKRDVKRIFDELKRQEEKIRAKVNKQNQKEQKNEKDW